jgi:hypothetical protein
MTRSTGSRVPLRTDQWGPLVSPSLSRVSWLAVAVKWGPRVRSFPNKQPALSGSPAHGAGLAATALPRFRSLDLGIRSVTPCPYDLI